MKISCYYVGKKLVNALNLLPASEQQCREKFIKKNQNPLPSKNKKKSLKLLFNNCFNLIKKNVSPSSRSKFYTKYKNKSKK